ncbi:MAG: hypothetical protein SWK90_10875 [Chloroflexota bacterium]|nr:hypothetical protein [Chloroflexota bacterium]
MEHIDVVLAWQELTQLLTDEDKRWKFAENPVNFLQEYGLPSDLLEYRFDKDLYEQADLLEQEAQISKEDNMASGLPKLSAAAAKVLGIEHEMKITPMGVKFLTQPKVEPGVEWELTATITCTFSWFDKCKPDW